MASTLRAVTLVACLLSQVQHVQSKICYESNGFESTSYYDCAPDAAVSACCRPGDICYTNGLCHPGPDAEQGITPWYWHGCTDPTFQDPSCFSACFAVTGDGVYSCPNQGPNKWCCYGLGGCDCNNSTQVVSALAGSIITTIDFGVTSISSTKTTKTTATTTPTSDSTTTTTTPPTTTAGKETTTDGGAAAGETTGQTAGTTPTETPTSEKSKSNALPIGVGVGVGGAAAIAIAGLIFFFMRRRKQQVAAAQMIGPEPKYTAAAQVPQYEMPARGGNASELPAAPHPIEYYQELPAER
ncbi:hypothetical protein V499_00054 [Pseudogymnoascus sp. VKM F-103]|uniref:Mid2 domain-containing protein n=1 Tax=Pseudogymnoascus verrucosus TaxID=342668 RepID=A0A1B8GRR4_9PEZI|nr:uncharacterized protein VE01_03462 [Pseudogymnoascus verrucosus]KFY81172.1 hypothetical protein V499_00054 [Pseudogymnoascus sp. VKM F-103]OBT98515.1 hypothetical protein VE01_03462 [Pseudogymnoascus verrucosus]